METKKYSGNLGPTKPVNYPFISQTCRMLQRVFTRKALPIQAEIYLKSEQWALIGNDARYKYGENIKDLTGAKLKVDPEDLHIPIEFLPSSNKESWILMKIESILVRIFIYLKLKDDQKSNLITEPVHSTIYIPSTLLEGAQEDDRIVYFLKEKKFELTLKQTQHPDSQHRTRFENALKLSKYSFKQLWKIHSEVPYFSREEVPESSHIFQKKQNPTPEETEELKKHGNEESVYLETYQDFVLSKKAFLLFPKNNEKQKITSEKTEELKNYDTEKLELLEYFISTDIVTKIPTYTFLYSGNRIESESIQAIVDQNSIFLFAEKATTNISYKLKLFNVNTDSLNLNLDNKTEKRMLYARLFLQTGSLNPDSIKITFTPIINNGNDLGKILGCSFSAIKSEK